MRVYWPDYYTEAHREKIHGFGLAGYLEAHGITCWNNYPPSNVDLLFCGSIYRVDEIRKAKQEFPNVPTVYYSWDLYPFQLEKNPDLWLHYIEDLKTCTEILVPSASCIPRMEQYTGRTPTVVMASIRPWYYPVTHGNYVVDVMREYPDPMCGAVKAACNKLGIECIEPKCQLPWEEYQKVIAGAGLLCSVYEEASTGGLSLLEGAWLGKEVLIGNSRLNGANEYHNPSWIYRRHAAPLDTQIMSILLTKGGNARELWERREWINQHFSEAAFALRLARVFWNVVNK